MEIIYPTGPIQNFMKQMYYLQSFKHKNSTLFETLTEREIEVLIQVANGRKNPAIAQKLGISRVTVQNHRANIREKLNITSHVDFIKYAMAFNLMKL